jgi:hypothetical protein
MENCRAPEAAAWTSLLRESVPDKRCSLITALEDGRQEGAVAAKSAHQVGGVGKEGRE